MKRKLFFWIDRLQISRSERISISILMVLMLVLTSALTFIDFSPRIDDDTYAELEKVFRERSEIRQQERDAIMARYTPVEAISAGEIDVSTDSEVMSRSESAVNSPEPEESAHAVSDTTRININEADLEELQQLPGIGPAYARRILEWREENGKFINADQLLEIRGIGPVRLEKIRPLIVL